MMSYFFKSLTGKPFFVSLQKPGLQFGRSNVSHLMEIHTTSPKGSPVLLTILYVIVALSAITGSCYN